MSPLFAEPALENEAALLSSLSEPDVISALVADALAEARAHAEQPPRFETRHIVTVGGIPYHAVYDAQENLRITEPMTLNAAEEQAKTWNRTVYPGHSAELKARISALSIEDRQEFNARIWAETVARMSAADRFRYGVEVANVG